jgi:hypothetical protein
MGDNEDVGDDDEQSAGDQKADARPTKREPITKASDRDDGRYIDLSRRERASEQEKRGEGRSNKDRK